MLKKILSLCLCAAMLLGLLPLFQVRASGGELEVYSGGSPVSQVTLQENETVLVSALLKNSASGTYQWQIQISKDTWANIVGSTAGDLNLRYAMIATMLQDGQATIRCRFTPVGEAPIYSNGVTVTVENAPVEQPGVHSAAPRVMAGAVSAQHDPDDEVRALQETEDVKKTYDIVIQYRFEDNTIAGDSYTATLAEGTSFSTTVNFPTVQGYLPYVGEIQQNSIDLNYTSVNNDVTILVTYKPTNVNYIVRHYQQNVNDDQYILNATEEKQGLTGSQVPELAKSYDGFYALIYERPEIAADGSTVIDIYYDRYYYLMKFQLDGGYGTEPVYVRYGAEIGTVAQPQKAGYTFGGWAETESGIATKLPQTMPAGNRTYYALWTPADTAKVTVVFWGENGNDEDYSYLAEHTKVLHLKPGTEFTYTEGEMLICGKEVHIHETQCLKCGKEAHSHSAIGGSCYTKICEVENHSHGTGCYDGVGAQQSVYTRLPSNPSNGMVYDHWVYQELIYIGGLWYHYSGSTASGSIAPTTCGKEESNHTHGEGCYQLSCTTEAHSHGGDCYGCGKEAHTHHSGCYEQGAGLDSKLWKFIKSDTIKVAADGSSVVNVYYDRTEFTLHFRKANSESDDYGTIQGKWGRDIRSKFEEKNNKSGTALWSTQKSGRGPWTGFLDKMPSENRTYYANSSTGNTHIAVYYGESLDGEGDTLLYTSRVIYDGRLVVTQEDKVEIEGFTYKYGTANQEAFHGAKFYYTRNSYTLTFHDGYNAVKNETVKYEAPLGQYADYVPEVPAAYEPGSVKFGGWYQNPQCTGAKYELNGKKMPANDIILYAKWVPVERTVTFYLDAAAYEAGKKLESHPDRTVLHGSKLTPEPAEPQNGGYTFVGWFYQENGQEKAFDFANMEVRKNLQVYGKWSSNTLKEYTVIYKLKGSDTEIAERTVSSGLAGTTKTVEPKGGTELKEGYQEGYFPTVKSKSLLLDINSEDLTVVFEYVPMSPLPYTVKYLEKETGTNLIEDKVVSDNRKAVVTETFVKIEGYMPDAYQKRLVVTADGENVLYFYYTEDDSHAFYTITHYTQGSDGESWERHAFSQAIGDIGTHYTASPMTISGYTYKKIKYVVDGEEVTDITTAGAKLTENGLEINLYYIPNSYPYQVRYLEQGSGKVLHDPKNGIGVFGQSITETAIDIQGYCKVAPSSVTLPIQIETGSTPRLNIITFYYEEQKNTIDYVAVGPTGATNFGSVTPERETVYTFTGTAAGSTAVAASGFRFAGWYLDEDCTQAVPTDWVTGGKIEPRKSTTIDGKDAYQQTTYYAKFIPDTADLTITKMGCQDIDAHQSFVFLVTGPNGYQHQVVIVGNGSVTIKGLQLGTYTVHEVSNWSWRYEVEAQEIKLVAGAANIVTMKNNRTDGSWLDGNDYKQNIFKGKC